MILLFRTSQDALPVARAPVAFPGGYGTLDELFEALTLVQTGKMPRITIVLVGSESWRQAIDFDHLMEQDFISTQDTQLCEHADTAEEVVAVLTPLYGGTPPGRKASRG